MPSYVYNVQTSVDQGRSWSVVSTAVDERGYSDPQQLASDALDDVYRSFLQGNGGKPAPQIQVQVYDRPVSGPPVATSSIGTDRQWQATHDLLAEISADIRHFEAEKRDAEEQAVSTQTAILNAKRRLESVTRSAIQMKMPQVDIAHGAGRSREWVRRIQNTITTEQ